MIEYTLVRTENPILIALSGRLDALNATSFEKAMDDFLSKKQDHLVFDLKKLEYISSAGIRIFILLIQKLDASDKRIAILNPCEMVKEVFEISGLKEYIPILHHPDEVNDLK